jgi:TPP-dependent pyruvate/acetoin dehydrogenase alpha subunit
VRISTLIQYKMLRMRTVFRILAQRIVRVRRCNVICSTQDPIRGLQRHIEESGIATDAELKASIVMSFMTFLHAFNK